MESAGVEKVQEIYEAFGRGDVPAVLGAMDPEIEWREAEGFPYGGTYGATGKAFRAPFAHVWWLEAGRAVRFQQFTDTALVREALA